jgi:N-acetyl-gamma-glutamyl-phosphate reductase
MEMEKIKAGIMGAAGYTGGEMLRLLTVHPQVDILFAHSNSSAGKYLYQVHGDLLGDTEMKFTDKVNEAADIIFLCVGHGEAKKILSEYSFPESVKIIDLSQDFRLRNNANTSRREFIYGLPELNSEKISRANNIANPGCFATCIQLALLPLANAQRLNNDIHINATTGSTGAGQSLSPTSHYSWRNNNLQVYKAFEHQHLKEIGESLDQLQPAFEGALNFIPQRGAFTRGILASAYLKFDGSLEEAKSMYKEYYHSSAFVFVSDQPIDLKQVVNTNKCFLYLEKTQDRLLIISCIDNLLKGASGQAVQNMNLLFGLPETSGLKLKSTAF